MSISVNVLYVCMKIAQIAPTEKKILKNPILILVDGSIQSLCMRRVKFQRTFENHAKILSCMSV